MIQKKEDIFGLRDYLNLLKLLKMAKYFIKTDRKILYHSADSKKTEIVIEDKIAIFDYF